VQDFLPLLPVSLPLVLFCFLGFEATCSLSRIIENPRKNASRVILFSFGMLLTLTTLYQLFFYAAVGSALSDQANYLSAFPLLVAKTAPWAQSFLPNLFSLAVATSAMGGAYGVLYSNIWNLYSLADQQHLPFSAQLTKLNRFQIPVLCVLAEAVAVCIYLLSTKGSQIPLQYISTLGCLITYTVSVLSLIKCKPSSLSFAGLASCTIALWICFRGFIATSLTPLFGFGLILLVGTLLFKPHKKSA
jgi:amino acid transporter